MEVVDFATVTNRFSHDALGRRVAATDPAGFTTDPLGNAVLTGYDEAGRVISEDGAAWPTRRDYDAFGNTMESSGPLATFFVHRFSTKSLDSETSLYYYGYRFYAPVLGRWMNRDPIEERGGVNLFDMCCNTTTTRFDSIGLFSHRKYIKRMLKGELKRNRT